MCSIVAKWLCHGMLLLCKLKVLSSNLGDVLFVFIDLPLCNVGHIVAGVVIINFNHDICNLDFFIIV